MDPAYPLSVTLFWLVYTPLLLAAAVLFGCALYRYVYSRRTSHEAKDIASTPPIVTAELIALQAQFIVAPRLARQEVVALLRQAAGEEADATGARLPDDFDLLLELLSRSRPSVPARRR